MSETNLCEKQLKILIVDDEESIRDTLKWHFEDLGYEVFTASEPALCTLYRHDHCSAVSRCGDALFVDQDMPGMKGAEFIRLQAERGCKLPAKYKWIMTGAPTADIQAQAKALGCQIVAKPFSLAEAEGFVALVRLDRQKAQGL